MPASRSPSVWTTDVRRASVGGECMERKLVFYPALPETTPWETALL
ncbi:MAG: hypothetical protein IKN55_12055 [Oscillospiraceae bacterium]|nr:hypothetical protein [Oscillospiraceae bacterium]